MTEKRIQADIRRELNKTRRCRLVRNAIGFDEIHGVTYGLGTGSADLVGILRCGRAFAVEVKRPGKEPSKEQRAWWRAFRAWGGLGGVATSVAEALQLLGTACAQCNCALHATAVVNAL